MNTSGARYRGRAIEAVLFDLDGTLIDTLPDITIALNQSLAEIECRPVPQQIVRQLIGRGAAVLVERALEWSGRFLTEEERAALLERYLQRSMEILNELHASAYPGAIEGLGELKKHGLKLAVVTNKPYQLAVGALKHTGLLSAIQIVVGGDTCSQRKPDPEPLLHACKSLGVLPVNALMVGDSINDVVAARAAGLAVVCVPYGYNEGEDPRRLPCDEIIESLSQLPRLLGAHV